MASGPVGTLFLMRHGRTAENQKTYVGWGDPPLDASGIAQATALLDVLRHDRIDAIYSSPLLRAMQTALPIALARGLDVRIQTQMREINYGDYQGLSKEERQLNLRTAHRYERMRHGESLFDVYRRVKEFGAQLASSLRQGRKSLVVGHYWSNRMLMGFLEGVPFDEIVDAPSYRPVNGSVLEVICRPAAEGVLVSRAAVRGEERAAS